MEASPVIKLPLFLGGLLIVLHWSRRGSCLWLAFFLALFLHFAAATAARSLVTTTAARATAALVTTTTAALATTAHRPAAAATTRGVREQVAEAAAERATVA